MHAMMDSWSEDLGEDWFEWAMGDKPTEKEATDAQRQITIRKVVTDLDLEDVNRNMDDEADLEHMDW